MSYFISPEQRPILELLADKPSKWFAANELAVSLTKALGKTASVQRTARELRELAEGGYVHRDTHAGLMSYQVTISGLRAIHRQPAISTWQADSGQRLIEIVSGCTGLNAESAEILVAEAVDTPKPTIFRTRTTVESRLGKVLAGYAEWRLVAKVHVSLPPAPPAPPDLFRLELLERR